MSPGFPQSTLFGVQGLLVWCEANELDATMDLAPTAVHRPEDPERATQGRSANLQSLFSYYSPTVGYVGSGAISRCAVPACGSSKGPTDRMNQNPKDRVRCVHRPAAPPTLRF